MHFYNQTACLIFKKECVTLNGRGGIRVRVNPSVTKLHLKVSLLHRSFRRLDKNILMTNNVQHQILLSFVNLY